MVGTQSPAGPRHGLARVLSKRGLCSRSQAEAWVRAGRVTLGGRVVLDPEYAVDLSRPFTPLIDGQPVAAVAPVYAMLNKPRGLVTSAADERGRDTVYRCFDGGGLGWIAPVGRLDKASEGLLLFSNDPAWAARITDPATGPRKTYHVQVDGLPGTTSSQRWSAASIAATAASLQRQRRSCAAATAPRGSRSDWTKDATGRSVACSRPWTCACGGWCASPSAPW